MSEYQTKFHKYICETFRWLAFVSVSLTLVVWLVQIWFPDILPKETFSKAIGTTIGITLAAGAVMIIFTEKLPNKKKAE